MKKSEFNVLELEYFVRPCGDKNRRDQEQKDMIHITEQMTELFRDNDLLQSIHTIADDDALNVEVTKIDQIKEEKITAEELGRVSQTNQNSGKLWLTKVGPVAVFLMLATVVLIKNLLSSNRNPAGGASPYFVIMVGLWIIIVAAILLYLTRQFSNHKVDANSMIKRGKAAFFHYHNRTMSGTDLEYYYVDVAFYDEKKLVRNIDFSKNAFSLLEQDSDVWIINGVPYAYDEKQGRFVC